MPQDRYTLKKKHKTTEIAKIIAVIANKCGQVEHPSVALFYIFCSSFIVRSGNDSLYFVTLKINTN